MISVSRRFGAFAIASLLAMGAATQANADQIGQFAQLDATPKFSFTNLGTVGGTISGTIEPGIFIDNTSSNVYSPARLVLDLLYVSGNTYSGSFIITDGTDTLLAANYTGELTLGNGSLSLNNISTSGPVSTIFDPAVLAGLTAGFTFTNLAGSVGGTPIISGSGTANGAASFATAAVPEPASIAMLCLGLAAPAALAYRRRSASN